MQRHFPFLGRFFGRSFGLTLAGAVLLSACHQQAAPQASGKAETTRLQGQELVTSPVTTFSLSPAPSSPANLYTTPVTVRVSAYDLGGSDIAEVRCVLNPREVPYTFDDLPAGCNFFDPVTLSEDGTYKLYASSSNTSGNREKQIKTISFQIQQHGLATVPAVSLLHDFGNDCAVTATGGVRCWGDPPLGNGSYTGSVVPVDVAGLSDVRALGGGEGLVCALTNNSATQCWGRHFPGSPNFISSFETDRPTNVTALGSGVQEISAGVNYGCAVTNVSGAKCWGTGGYGVLGNGTGQDMVTPTDVVGLTSGVAQIAAGPFHACALTTAGGVKCWGNGRDGELGTGVWEPHGPTSDVPVDVIGLSSGVTAISSGEEQSCALTTAGGVKCWGTDSQNALNTPYDIFGLTSGVKAVRVGPFSGCALTNAGGVKCWGLNSEGALGNGTTQSSSVAVDVVGLTSGVKDISTHCAVMDTGEVKCWGNGNLIPVGIASFGPPPTPNPGNTTPGSDTIQLQATLTPGKDMDAKSVIRIEVTGAPAGAKLSGEYQIATAPACGRDKLTTLLYHEFRSRSMVFTDQQSIALQPGSALLASVRVRDSSGKLLKNLYTQSCLN